MEISLYLEEMLKSALSPKRTNLRSKGLSVSCKGRLEGSSSKNRFGLAVRKGAGICPLSHSGLTSLPPKKEHFQCCLRIKIDPTCLFLKIFTIRPMCFMFGFIVTEVSLNAYFSNHLLLRTFT